VFTLPVPRDYLLRRDVCSYGYFLLEPNHWDPAREVFTRTLELDGGPVFLCVSQPGAAPGTRPRPGTPLRVRESRRLSKGERTEAARLLSRMLRLDEAHAVIRRFHRLDPRWRRSGRGRLMRSPTLFEDVIKTVTSCNVTWPSTITMNRRLCEVLGRPAVDAAGRVLGHSFPTAQRIARARAATLRARCRTGYRDARIIELARLFARGAVDPAWFEDPATPDGEVHAALLDLPGIGPYAAANIMQLLGRYGRLPLDTESVRHGKTIMGLKGSDRAIMRAMHAHFAPFGPHAFRSYWFELWEFYESKHGPSWTWQRDSTGRLFTAAMLNA
jgi:3-methyladenine DNA glycosylase/8-oxoguanine DNA glycosylase